MGGTTATGGTGGMGGSGGTDECGALIDDMETETGLSCSTSGRLVSWFSYGDIRESFGSTQGSPVRLATPRISTSEFAMYLTGMYEKFAGLGVFLNTRSYDASAYTGIRFWAKGSDVLFVTGQMASTESTIYGGVCTLGEAVCAGNTYEVGKLSSSTWTEYKVPFALMTGGTVSPFDPKSIWSLEFQFKAPPTSTARISFEMWLDDLYFY